MPHQKYTNQQGEVYPSVTEILGCLSKDWKEYWWRKVGFAEADKIGRESRELGTACHKLVEYYLDTSSGVLAIQGKDLELDLFEIWLRWFKKSGLVLVSQEQLVVSDKYKYCGTYDCLMKDDKGQLILVDWKFSKNQDSFRPIQLGGYSLAINETQKQSPVKKALIVQVHPVEKKVIVTKVNSLKKYEKQFIVLRKAYDIWKGKKK